MCIMPAANMAVLMAFLGTPLAWCMSLALLFKQEQRRGRLWAALHLFCIGYWHLGGALIVSGWIWLYPAFYRSEILMTFLTGPSGYFFFRSRLESHFSWRWSYSWAFLPGLLAAGLYIPLYQISNQSDFIQATIEREQYDVFQVAIVIGASQNVIYLIAGLWRFFYPGRFAMRARQKLLLLLLLGFVLVITLMDLFAWNKLALWNLDEVRWIFTLGSSAALAGIMIVWLAYPSFLDDLILQLQSSVYKKTRLAGLDLDAVQVLLERIMKTEEIYLSSDLSLALMAAKVDLNPAQLSQFINQVYGCNFNSFINRYRIQAACDMLSQDPQLSNLHVCYSVGFNSSSAYHAAFKSCTGKSPAHWKKNLRNHDSGSS